MPKLVKSYGFTLIELLVVISIIAVLATIGFVNYQQAVKKGRDARRQADLKIMQSALEQYHTDNHFYPPSILDATTAGGPLDNCSGGISGCTVSKVYIITIPLDPRSISPYVYRYFTPAGCGSATPTLCTTYCLYATLEAETPGMVPGCTNTAQGNFSVSRP